MSVIEKDNWKLALTMGISWVLFIAWEIYVSAWAHDVEGPILRVDLILILPGLLIISAYSLTQMIKR